MKLLAPSCQLSCVPLERLSLIHVTAWTPYYLSLGEECHLNVAITLGVQ